MARTVATPNLVAALLALASLASACAPGDTTVTFDTFKYPFPASERRLVQTVANDAIIEIRRALPSLPRPFILRVHADSKVIPETGETGSTSPPNIVYWTVDASREGGVEAVVRAQLRATLFHECHHLVRAASVTNTTLMDAIVTEGLATAFERDFAGGQVPWGAYPGNVADWVRELIALPPDTPRDQWMGHHPDGRRWIGYKSGTFIVDQAMKRSGKSAADLVAMPTDELLKLAGFQGGVPLLPRLD